jgi:hypothetical protein
MELSILPECFVDTNLIETLVPPAKGYNHQKGCGKIAKIMQEKFHDRFALGVIDKDKKELKYAQEFDLIIDKGDIQLFRHKEKNKHHYLIFILPAAEEWIIKNTEIAGILLEDYGLPSGLRDLLRISKKVTSKHDCRFKQLFHTLKNSRTQSIEILSEWIQYLKENNYKSDMKKLIEITENKCV